MACTGLTNDPGVPVAIEVVSPPDSMHVNDTIVIHVRVLNRSGDSLTGLPVFLIPLNPDTIGVDSAKVAVIGRKTGTGRVVATSGGLPSQPFQIPIK